MTVKSLMQWLEMTSYMKPSKGLLMSDDWMSLTDLVQIVFVKTDIITTWNIQG